MGIVDSFKPQFKTSSKSNYFDLMSSTTSTESKGPENPDVAFFPITTFLLYWFTPVQYEFNYTCYRFFKLNGITISLVFLCLSYGFKGLLDFTLEKTPIAMLNWRVHNEKYIMYGRIVCVALAFIIYMLHFIYINECVPNEIKQISKKNEKINK